MGRKGSWVSLGFSLKAGSAGSKGSQVSASGLYIEPPSLPSEFEKRMIIISFYFSGLLAFMYTLTSTPIIITSINCPRPERRNLIIDILDRADLDQNGRASS